MLIALTLGVLCVLGLIGALIAPMQDSRGPIRDVSDYDTRRPLL